jgi:hypothetical protein
VRRSKAPRVSPEGPGMSLKGPRVHVAQRPCVSLEGPGNVARRPRSVPRRPWQRRSKAPHPSPEGPGRRSKAPRVSPEGPGCETMGEGRRRKDLTSLFKASLEGPEEDRSGSGFVSCPFLRKPEKCCIWPRRSTTSGPREPVVQALVEIQIRIVRAKCLERRFTDGRLQHSSE